MGGFIVVEGGDGSGKSTLIKNITEFLSGFGYNVVVTNEPGGTKLGRSFRQLLLDPDNKNLSVPTELLLFAADRAQHVEEVIKPALERGDFVVCSRYIYSTVAYQGFARGIDRLTIDLLNNIATGGLRPALVLLLDLPVEVGLSRVSKEFVKEGATSNPSAPKLENTTDRLEQLDLDFHRAVREGFLAQARDPANNFVIIDSTEDRCVVLEQAKEAVQRVFTLRYEK